MALNKNEKAILEAVSGMLQQDAKLGLAMHKSDESSHHSQFRWEGIDDLFTLKVAGSPYKDSLSSAFFAVHQHKYIDHPTFELSLEKEMSARGLPAPVREEAIGHLNKIVKELSEDEPSELDAGWNPDMKGIQDVTSNADNREAKTSKPFTGGGPAPEGDHDIGKPIGG